ncbi:MAG TPA: 4Fe-4S binding protein [Bacteroidales bacterium]|nr:4Fe-4S binding protein [Bacteroidales bacterium]
MKKLFTFNLITRILFLLLTPTLFRALNFAFIWHSIYWGTITIVVITWGVIILISPLLGRLGCGWICFMGTIQDITGQRSLFRIGWKKPLLWIRILNICAFFTTALIFFFIRLDSGKITGIRFDPWFLNMDFSLHYKQVWLYDTMGAVLLGLLLERRWACRNLCFMGALCASGASVSRLIPVVDVTKCNLCGKCETDCLVRIPVADYVKNNNGLVTSSECLVCGKCIESCKPRALSIKFIWNRKKYIQKISLPVPVENPL